jgi:ABC-type multidrug transport system ATPase subunit
MVECSKRRTSPSTTTSRFAVKDVSLRVEASKVISIMWPNGAGKSTLLRALNGNVKATAAK